jgi:hypothetical protein
VVDVAAGAVCAGLVVSVCMVVVVSTFDLAVSGALVERVAEKIIIGKLI